MEIQKRCLDDREERLKESEKAIEEDKMCSQLRVESLKIHEEKLKKQKKCWRVELLQDPHCHEMKVGPVSQ